MAKQPRRYARGLLSALLVVGLSLPLGASGGFWGAGPAKAQDLSSVGRELVEIEGDARQLTRQNIARGQEMRSATFVEERLTDGELYYRLQDYDNAIILFTDIVDNHPQHRAYPDALYLLADSLFRAGDYMGARRHFITVVDRSDELAFRPFAHQSLGRLIEIAIHTRDFEGIEGHFDRLSRLPSAEVEAATTYFKAKYLYNRAVPTEDVLRAQADGATSGAPAQIDMNRLDQARQLFEGVGRGSPYYLQARYFVGVIFTLRATYPQAIEAFRRVLQAPATSDEHRAILELTQLALGRLYYETDQLDQAIEAYQGVSRTSSNFDVALFELAWVFIRQGDSTRAERALEVLSVATPDSRYIPDGKLLRANLLLRNGRFDDAESVFREVREEFGPVRREIEEMLGSHADPDAYFRELVRANMTHFDANQFLPESARRWVDLDDDMNRAMGVLSDLSQARRLVEQTHDLVVRLAAALAGGNRVNVFGDLRRHRQGTVALRNRLSRVQKELIAIEGESLPGGTDELRRVREDRRRIERMLGGMPTSDEDFHVRDDQLNGRYQALQRELGKLNVEVMGIEARITATRQFLAQSGAELDAEANESLRSEVEAQEQAVQAYREQIVQLQRLVEAAQLQVGVGDARYERDAELRTEYEALLQRERQLLAAAGVRRPREMDRLFAQVADIQGTLDRHDALINTVADERSERMKVVIEEESAKLGTYRERLAELQGETETVVGGITMNNFNKVKQRFYDLVLRADVGRVDVAWARREEHRMRVDLLNRERSRELQAMDDEFQEIMDLNQGGEEGGL